jgi:crotonobetainyl-CoA:carnitine CoA-transferase CaiB-like acyl-CoA transferase
LKPFVLSTADRSAEEGSNRTPKAFSLSELSSSNLVLNGLRVIEMVDNDSSLAGKLLADLGAEVVKIENPRLDRSRTQGPFLTGEGEKAQSLRWMAYNLGKQSLQLDVDSQSSRSALAELVSVADIFLESTPPGYLARRGLDYSTLSRANPSLVMVSITPFGQNGPYSAFLGDDLVLWAMGGMLYVTGQEDRPPVQISVPQAYLVAGAYAALAAIIANTHCRRTGQGQYVDLSVQACIPWVAQTAPDYWPCFKGIQRRGGTGWTIPSEVEQGGLRRTTTWRCRNGYVCAYLIAGGPAEKMNSALFQWMRDEGFNPPETEGISWDYFGLRRIRQSVVDRIEDEMARFFRGLDKERLFAEGQKRGVMVYPVMDIGEVLKNEHLKSRRSWSYIAAPDARRLKVPSRWVHFSLNPLRQAEPAPGLDQHSDSLNERWKNAGKRKSVELSALNRPLPKQPFEGLLVADFSWAVAGPLTTKYFAEHGATVVRIESCDLKSMDIVRAVPPYYADNPSLEGSGLFHRLNVNKLSMSLDLGTPEGRELARRLAVRADVLVENFRPGVMEKWGLDYNSLSFQNPALIYLSSTNLGQTGPLSSYGGFGNLLTAYAGFYSLTGWPDGEPLPLPGAYSDYITPILSGLALIAALRHRDRTGEGQHLDISQMECSLQMLCLPLMNQASGGIQWPRLGNRSPYACPHGVFPCLGQDKWCAISIQSDQQWQAFKDALGKPEVLESDMFSTNADRVQNQRDLEEEIVKITSAMQAEQLMWSLQEHGVPAGLVATSEDLFMDPQLNSRGYYQKMQHPLIGDLWIMQSPPVFDRTPQLIKRHAPCLGQDNESVCQEILGMELAEIKALAGRGAFGQWTGTTCALIFSTGKGGYS